MKKFLFGCFMFLGGLIGVMGWLNACATLNSGRSRRVLYAMEDVDNFVIVIFFLFISVRGVILAVSEMKKDEN